MRRFTIAAVAAMALTGALAPSAGAADGIDGPCATQRALFEKYNIELNMHFPLLEESYSTVCSVTG